MVGREVPHGHALRGLEVRGFSLPLPEPRLQTQCNKCQAPKSQAKWELPQDPLTRTCGCGTKVFPNFRGACRTCRAPIEPLEGGKRIYNPLGGAPLPDPPIASDLQGHSAEPIMLWTEAMVNPMGPPVVSGNWPAAPEIDYQTVKEPSGERFKVPYVTSDAVPRLGRWTTASSVGSSWDTDGAPGRTPIPPALLPVENRLVAVQPARDRPHPHLVGTLHLLRRPPARQESHPRPVGAHRTEAGLPQGNLHQGAHAPLPGELARGLATKDPRVGRGRTGPAARGRTGRARRVGPRPWLMARPD